jgi:hypothetical protein
MQRELAAHPQRLEAPIEAAEPDQAVPAVIGLEHRQVAPGLEIAEIARPLVAERAAAILRELARQVGDLFVAAVVLDREVQGGSVAKSRADGLW